MEVFIFDEQEALPLPHALIQKIAAQVVAYEGKRFDEVSLHFVSSESISALHEEFFDDPSPTDCISFPMDSGDEPGYQVLGEVFVCPEVAIEYAATHKKNPYEETTLYIVHGLLHLMGYDDMEKEDRLAMRAAEKRHMDALKKLNICLA